MEQAWNVVSGAPWWVYLLFIYFIVLGVKSFKPRTVAIRKVILVPAFFIIWSGYVLYGKVMLGLPSLFFVWIGCLALGICVGFIEVRSWHIDRDLAKQEITIPGNYSTLVLTLVIFTSKFTWNYFYATRAEVPYSMYCLDTIISAIVSGCFIGRSGVFLRHYYKQS